METLKALIRKSCHPEPFNIIRIQFIKSSIKSALSLPDFTLTDIILTGSFTLVSTAETVSLSVLTLASSVCYLTTITISDKKRGVVRSDD